MSNPFPEIDRDELLERLEQGGERAVTVLTPNRRLAQSLEAEVDRRHLAAGRAHWDAADILAFDHFLARCHEEALYSARGADVPSLLSEAAARILWEEAIGQSRWKDGLLSLPAAAALASEAWALAHDWRIQGALRSEQSSEDAEAFAEWATHYARRTDRENVIDSARLPASVARYWAEKMIAPPAAIALYAFDVIKPQQADLLSTCAGMGTQVFLCQPARHEATLRRVVIETPREEIEQAARWARARLEAADPARAPRIAVVVPELSARRREVVRIFARTFAPNGSLASRSGAPYFNLSLGEPLTEYPLVDAALTLLEIATQAVAYDRASRLIRSPFLADAEAEVAGRARLDAALRRIAPGALNAVHLRRVAPEGVKRGAPPCRGFIELLERVIEKSQDNAPASAHTWARRFNEILRAAGFPGERSLDSVEYQALERWRESLAEFAALGSIATHWSGREARARLVRLCRETVFQPRSGQAPVQVLGILESAGLTFDHLWVSGLTEDAWPIASRAHPLIAPALQRRAGIPQASPEEALEFDRRITTGWRVAAPEVVFSSARADGDRELVASPLVADVTKSDDLEALAIPKFIELRRQILAKRKDAMSKTQDDIGPALPTPFAKGGTNILVDQAACPFRAFAHYRLGARELEAPASGLAPMERGTLLHEMMGKLWEAVKDSATLVSMDDAALAKHIDEAAAHAVRKVQEDRPGRLDGRFADLERERIAALAREWLAIEKTRAPFRVHQREEKWKLHAGGVEIDGRIDRVDELAGGGLAVIDYKTGRVSAADWNGERPDNAQMPLYALAADRERLHAVAFASLKTGDLRFVGVSRDENILPKVKTPTEVQGGSWDAMLQKWRVVVDRLGADFAAGQATVDPKELLTTCRRCDLKTLCRVHERLSPLDEGDELDDAGEEKAE
ncbi:PD-(D/E)XK nuclease family protein [Usitatibacter palustris]|uniref:PD-(D/E)XK endonuclease-like domain-containing protein n=1 Tax=Usitatibacter palustris TaxID=2732487 RepID=A0A6M4H377_9PROT|nr:PD-(D/E)XK nuclease family protein [Usitatibacter palustris]QJR13986.1 hypothetical protein DSM104440_00778 [Usitatibacter palustris]